MNITIIGGGGLVGQKLARALAARGTLQGRRIAGLTLADVVDPATAHSPIEAPFPVSTIRCDITDPASVAAAVGAETNVIFLLAAIVSGQAEEEFDLGYDINLFGTRNVLERVRELGTKATVVFTSSVAVFGGEVPDPITDTSFLNPQTSYGAQKAAGELLINDYARKGYVDGRAFRLPTISVRPGKPNRAASGFMSSIFREPLQGQEAICPVGRDFPHYYLSPRKCVENLIKGAEAPAAAFGMNRAMTMPGRTWTIGEMIDAMVAVAGPAPAELIRFEEQPEIWEIVKGWRYDVHAERARGIGMEADASFEDNIRYFLEDDLA